MWIIKRQNRRSDKARNPFFFRIGGESKTDTAGAVVMDLECAAEVMEGAFADRVKMTHAAEVAAREPMPAPRPTLWSQYGQRAAAARRSAPLIETTGGDLLGRRGTDRGTGERRQEPVADVTSARLMIAFAQAS